MTRTSGKRLAVTAAAAAIVAMVIATATACSSGTAKQRVEPAPPTTTAVTNLPPIDCDEIVPKPVQDRLLVGRQLTHERSCADGACFADTCSYRRNASDLGVRVVLDCRADAADGRMLRDRAYFSTARMKARRVYGVGAAAVIDADGLSFVDEDAGCLVTIRSDGDEDNYLELARIIEANL
jgi:hypothetical protein